MGCCNEKWYAWKIKARTGHIVLEDSRGRFDLYSNLTDYDGYYVFYVISRDIDPHFYGEIVKKEFLGEV